MIPSQIAKILDGNFKDIKNKLQTIGLYGIYQGYPIVIRFEQAITYVTFQVVRQDDPENKALEKFWMETILNEKNFSSVDVEKGLITYGLKPCMTLNQQIEQINTLIPSLTHWLEINSYEAVCYGCNCRFKKLDFYTFEHSTTPNEYGYLCEECVMLLDNYYKKGQQEIRSRTSRFFPGVVGAILGSSLGAILWIVIYIIFGKLASISGVVATRFAVLGYNKFGKGFDIKAYFTCIIIAFGMIVLGATGSWTWQLYNLELIPTNTSIWDAFINTIPLLQEHNHFQSYLLDIFTGCFLGLISVFSEMKNLFRKLRGSYSIKKK